MPERERSVNLELMALRWLRWEKHCVLALCERSPRQYQCGEPDALGVTSARYLIEIEIKRSLSDFKADFTKRSRNPKIRPYIADELPKQFYYLIPRELFEKVEPRLPEWAGLMTPNDGGYSLEVRRVSPVNKESKRLTVRECCRLLLMVNNHAISSLEVCERHFGRWKEGHWPWPEPDYEI